MFSDLVGSTALSSRMDPEDLREVIAAFHSHFSMPVPYLWAAATTVPSIII